MTGTTACVVVAGGRGRRLGEPAPKAFVEIAGRSLLQHAVDAVQASGVVDLVVAVVPSQHRELAAAQLEPTVRVVAGAPTRAGSVRCGLRALPPEVSTVLVHDAARALTPASLVVDVVRAVRAGHPAVVPGIAVVDTLRSLDGAAVDRRRLVAVQTPQGFTRELLERAHREAGAEDAAGAEGATEAVADDAGLVDRLGVRVHVVPGHDEAFKVTRPLDLATARAVLARRVQPA